MCGIFFYYGKEYSIKSLLKEFNSISHRGPDDFTITRLNDNVIMGFHRLAINGLDKTSGQPLQLNGVYLICNGEIYNFKQLADKFNVSLKTQSDCEIILHLYMMFGIDELLKLINGEFAFVIYDSNTDNVYVTRDPLGIRSLYWSQNDNGSFFVASEMKAIPGTMETVEQFPGGYYALMNSHLTAYYSFDYIVIENVPRHIWLEKIKACLEDVCKERLMSDRSIGCILSGGLDSTLVTAIICKQIRERNPLVNINTYTIGLEGGTDLYYASMAAKYLNTTHHEFIVTEKEFLEFIPDTIKQIESYDVTTVRASVGNYLLAKKIKELDKDAVLFCGDVADELMGSYRGFQNAVTNEEFFEANVHMLKNIQYFDVLRSDKSIAGAGLEARVPYGDKKFVDLIMSLPSEFKVFNSLIIEKQIIRDAFKGYLPEQLLYRKKEAFSDGVSQIEKSWHEIIKEYVDTIITDEEYETSKGKYLFNQPYDKESYYYRKLFEEFYPKRETTIPYFWKHPFTDAIDPSARTLNNY